MLRGDEAIGALLVTRREPGALPGQAGRAPPDVRRPGRHRHRERAPLPGAAGEDRAARDRRTGTSPSSSPTCRTSCARRSTPSSASPRCCSSACSASSTTSSRSTWRTSSRSGRHLLSLINDILDLSKIEAGRMELDLAPFDLPLALDNALTLVKERAARHGIAARRWRWTPAWASLVGDERKIKQVLLNLLSNAVKFTPEGGRVVVRAERADGTVEISVADTGIGIAAEDQEAIFEEFRQVGTDYARKREGRASGWRWRGASSSCTGADLGEERAWGRDRRSPSRFRSGHGRRADPDRRGQREEPEARAGPARSTTATGSSRRRPARRPTPGRGDSARAHPHGHPASRHQRHRGAAASCAPTRPPAPFP